MELQTERRLLCSVIFCPLIVGSTIWRYMPPTAPCVHMHNTLPWQSDPAEETAAQYEAALTRARDGPAISWRNAQAFWTLQVRTRRHGTAGWRSQTTRSLQATVHLK